MADTLELLSRDHPTYEWALNNVQSLARELLKAQDASGFWRALPRDREAYLESSTAAFQSFCLHLCRRDPKGLRVMCEKPVALHADEAWDLVATAQARNARLLAPYGWHYKPFVQRAKQLMDEGCVGQVEYVLCRMASPTKDFFSGGGSVPAKWEPTLAKPDTTTWQVKDYGGGYAHGQVTHSSALMFWLTGLRARQVSAIMTEPNSQVDMYNAATVQFTNHAIGTISGAATLTDNDKFQVDVRIFGSEGVLLLDVERERLKARRHDGRHIHVDVPAGEGAYSCEGPPNRFVELIQGRGRNDSSGEVAARSVELIEAMHESAHQNGKPVLVRAFRS